MAAQSLFQTLEHGRPSTSRCRETTGRLKRSPQPVVLSDRFWVSPPKKLWGHGGRVNRPGVWPDQNTSAWARVGWALRNRPAFQAMARTATPTAVPTTKPGSEASGPKPPPVM